MLLSIVRNDEPCKAEKSDICIGIVVECNPDDTPYVMVKWIQTCEYHEEMWNISRVYTEMVDKRQIHIIGQLS